MAKLSKGGFGVGDMIGFLVVFIFVILIIAFLVYDVDHEKDSDIQLIQEEFVIFE